MEPSWRRAGARIAALGLSAALLLALGAQPASAHGGLPHFASAITRIDPAVPGMHITTAPDGRYLRMTNPTRRTVVVLGPNHQEYLRITAHGVWRSTHAPANYLDGSPAAAGVDAEWTQVSTSDVAQFHDDRIRWTAPARPDVVVKEPQKLHLIRNWTIDLLVDGTPVAITGTLSWHPGSSPTSLAGFAVVCLIILAGLVFLLIRAERRDRARGLGPRKPPDRHAETPTERP